MGFLLNLGIGALGTVNNNFEEARARRQDLIEARMTNLYREKDLYNMKKMKGEEERLKAQAALSQLQGMYPEHNLTLNDAYSFQKSGQLNDILDGKQKIKGVTGKGTPVDMTQQTQDAFAPDPRDRAAKTFSQAFKSAFTGGEPAGIDEQARSRFQSSVGMSDKEMQMMRNGYASDLDIPTDRTYQMDRTSSGAGGSPTERMLARYVELAARPQGSLSREEAIELSALEVARTKIITGPDNITNILNPRSAIGMGGGFASPPSAPGAQRQPHKFTPGQPMDMPIPGNQAQPGEYMDMKAPADTDPDPYMNPVNRNPDNSVLNKAGTWALNRSTPQKIPADIEEAMVGGWNALAAINSMVENFDKAGWMKGGQITGEALKSRIGGWMDTDTGAAAWATAEGKARTAIQGLIKGTPSNYDASLFEKTVPSIDTNPTKNLYLMKDFMREANLIVRNNIEYMHQQRMEVNPTHYDLADQLARNIMTIEGMIDEAKLAEEVRNAPEVKEEKPAKETKMAPAADAPLSADEVPSFNSPDDPGFKELPKGAVFMYNGKLKRKQ